MLTEEQCLERFQHLPDFDSLSEEEAKTQLKEQYVASLLWQMQLDQEIKNREAESKRVLRQIHILVGMFATLIPERSQGRKMLEESLKNLKKYI